MSDSYLVRVAGEIADMAIADENATGDIRIIDEIAKVLGSSSQTLEEAFLTAVRVRKAEARARALLQKRAADGYAAAIAGQPNDTASRTPKDTASDDTASDMSQEAQPEIPSAEDIPPQTGPSDETPQDNEKSATDDAIERLKRAGIGMPRRVPR